MNNEQFLAIFEELTMLLSQTDFERQVPLQKVVSLKRIEKIALLTTEFLGKQVDSNFLKDLNIALEAEIKQTREYLKTVESKIEQLLQKHKLTEEVYRNLNIKKLELEELQHNIDSDNGKAKVIDDELKQKKQEHEELTNKLLAVQKEIVKIDALYSQKFTIYKQHFSENKTIWGNLSDLGHTNRYVSDLIKEIETRLDEFDKSIGQIIQKRDAFTILQIVEKKVD